jgi:hypothetical protein
VRVKPTTIKALNMIRGFIISQEGKDISQDDVINILMMQAKFSPKDFPDWPIFKLPRRELERALRDFNETLKSAFDSTARKSPYGESSKPRNPREKT